MASDRDLHWFTSVSFDGLKYRLGSDFYPMIFGTFLFVNQIISTVKLMHLASFVRLKFEPIYSLCLDQHQTPVVQK